MEKSNSLSQSSSHRRGDKIPDVADGSGDIRPSCLTRTLERLVVRSMASLGAPRSVVSELVNGRYRY
jgi:hypothetical protein